MASGETAEQIAKSLGITRSTLFRRLKKAKTLQILSKEANVKTDGKLWQYLLHIPANTGGYSRPLIWFGDGVGEHEPC